MHSFPTKHQIVRIAPEAPESLNRKHSRPSSDRVLRVCGVVLHLNQLHARGDDAVDIKDPAQSYIRYKWGSMVHTSLMQEC